MFGLIILIAALGFFTYLIVTYIPMAPPFKQVIMIVAVVVLIFILINAFGLWRFDQPLPQFRR